MELMKGMVKDSTKCVLSYMLSQPVEIDVIVLSVFISEYVGRDRFGRMCKLVRSAADLVIYGVKHSSKQLLAVGFSQRSAE
jgi:hypothetical protein